MITAEDQTWSVPFNNALNYRTQFLFDACQLGTGGPVTGISLRLADPSAASDYANATIVLGHTTNTTLSITYADNMTDPTTVFSGALSVLSGLNAGDWVTLPVSGFTYDPTQNLVVEVTQDAGTAVNDILATNTDTPGASGAITGDRTGTDAVESGNGQCSLQVHLSK